MADGVIGPTTENYIFGQTWCVDEYPNINEYKKMIFAMALGFMTIGSRSLFLNPSPRGCIWCHYTSWLLVASSYVIRLNNTFDLDF